MEIARSTKRKSEPIQMVGPKKQKLEEMDHFASLNDDCINEIFSWLELDDLCAISRTCKKLRCLAGREFEHKYPEKKISILKPDGKPNVFLSPNESYVKCFSQHIQNVVVCLSNFKLNFDLAAFMRTHINESPKKIIFSRGQFYIDKSFADGIKSILENVQCVIFSRCYGNKNNFYDEILKHCNQLVHLELLPSYHAIHDQLPATLPLHQHKHLKSFMCHFMDKQMTEHFNEFLKLNATVKQLSCTFGRQLSYVDISKCFRAAADHSINLEDVSFGIERSNYDDINLSSIENELEVLCNSERINRCELNLFENGISSMTNVASLAAFSGIKCNGSSMPFIVASKAPFTKMKVLIFTGSVLFSEQMATDLSKMMPNLEILSLKKVGFDEGDKITDILTPFVLLKQLKEIYLLGYHLSKVCEEIYAELLSKKREDVNGACKLVMYLCPTFCEKIFKKASKTSVNNEKDFVRLAPANSKTAIDSFSSFDCY